MSELYVRGVDGSCAEHLTIESNTVIISLLILIIVVKHSTISFSLMRLLVGTFLLLLVEVTRSPDVVADLEVL